MVRQCRFRPPLSSRDSDEVRKRPTDEPNGYEGNGTDQGSPTRHGSGDRDDERRHNPDYPEGKTSRGQAKCFLGSKHVDVLPAETMSSYGVKLARLSRARRIIERWTELSDSLRARLRFSSVLTSLLRRQ